MAPGLLDIALLTVFGSWPLGRHCVQVHLAFCLLGSAHPPPSLPSTAGCPPSAQSTLHRGLPTVRPVYPPQQAAVH